MEYEDIRSDIAEITARLSGVDEQLSRIERHLESLSAGNREVIELVRRLGTAGDHEDPAVASARELDENLPDRDA